MNKRIPNAPDIVYAYTAVSFYNACAVSVDVFFVAVVFFSFVFAVVSVFGFFVYVGVAFFFVAIVFVCIVDCEF